MAFLTDEDREPPWDPFASVRAERATQTESAEPDAGPEPVHSWGSGAIGRPSEAFVDPDTQMTRLLRGELEWKRHGVLPRPVYDPGMGIVPPS